MLKLKTNKSIFSELKINTFCSFANQTFTETTNVVERMKLNQLYNWTTVFSNANDGILKK